VKSKIGLLLTFALPVAILAAAGTYAVTHADPLAIIAIMGGSTVAGTVVMVARSLISRQAGSASAAPHTNPDPENNDETEGAG
jgi:hypothetical protein